MGSDNRDTYFDFLRGIAIIFVVGIHTRVITGLSCLELYSKEFILQIITIAVPLFTAISGYFLIDRHFEYRHGRFWKFFVKQVKKVYLPMLIWSVPFYLIGLKADNSLLFWTVYALPGGMSVMYFPPMIMQMHPLTPLLTKVKWGGG